VSDVVIKLVGAEDVWALRHRVLRPHLPVESARYPEDASREALHVAAVVAGVVVGIASVYREDEAGGADANAWRLRGMATAPEARGTGLGGRVLEAVIEALEDRGVTKVWCNARTSVAGFYERYGFAVFGEEYEMPGIGPHYLMKRFF
jgi:predicted GNAT family N-acyltransferase